MARTAKNPDGTPIKSSDLTKKLIYADPRLVDVIGRVVQEVPGVDSEAAAVRWMAGPAEKELDRMKAATAPIEKPFGEQSDYYRFGYMVGVLDVALRGVRLRRKVRRADLPKRLSPGCVVKCCDQPGLFTAHLRHVWDAMQLHPLARRIFASLRPDGLPERTDIVDQGTFWLGYYHGRGRKYHPVKPRIRPETAAEDATDEDAV